MSPSISRRGVGPSPAATVTLAQTEILAPIVLVVASVLSAVIGAAVRLFRRG